MSEKNIQQLIKENEELKREVARYKDKFCSIKEAVIKSIENTKEIEKQTRVRIEQNLIRLKLFDSKLVAYYKRLIEKYPLDDNLIDTEEFLKKMDDILNTDYMKRNVDDEMFKSKNPTFSYGNKVSFEGIEPNESGFDLNEALNPSEGLEDICRELGLI